MPSVLITGASRGLGLAFARQYAADGWRVIGTVRTQEGARRFAAEVPGAEARILDVTDFPSVARLGRDLQGESLDVLIANAGVLLDDPPCPSVLDERPWLESFEVNAMAPLACAGAFAAQVSRSAQKRRLEISETPEEPGKQTTQQRRENLPL